MIKIIYIINIIKKWDVKLTTVIKSASILVSGYEGIVFDIAAALFELVAIVNILYKKYKIFIFQNPP